MKFPHNETDSNVVFIAAAWLQAATPVLEEEIYTIPDFDSHKGVGPLVAKNLQRLELRRRPAKQ